MSMKSIIQAVETGVTRVVQTVETDAVTGEQKIVHFFHVIGEDVAGAFAKATAEASAEISKIQTDAGNAVLKVQERVAAIKAGLGL